MLKEIIANDFIKNVAQNNIKEIRSWYIVTTGDTSVKDKNVIQKAAQYIDDMGVYNKNGN